VAYSSKITVTTSPTLVGKGANGTANKPVSSAIYVPTGATIYFGGKNVSTTNGYPVVGPNTLSIDLIAETIWAVVAAGTVDVQVLHLGTDSSATI
jgi:hypothetical protein